MNAPVNHAEIDSETDPRLMFMARAGACHDLVMLGELDLDEAFDELIDQFEHIMGYDCCPTCGATPCVNPSFCVAGRESDKGGRDVADPEPQTTRATPETTIKAVVFSVRERGLGALKEPANIARLKQCDDAARATIDRCIAKMFPEGGAA